MTKTLNFTRRSIINRDSYVSPFSGPSRCARCQCATFVAAEDDEDEDWDDEEEDGDWDEVEEEGDEE